MLPSSLFDLKDSACSRFAIFCLRFPHHPIWGFALVRSFRKEFSLFPLDKRLVMSKESFPSIHLGQVARCSLQQAHPVLELRLTLRVLLKRMHPSTLALLNPFFSVLIWFLSGIFRILSSEFTCFPKLNGCRFDHESFLSHGGEYALVTSKIRLKSFRN